MNLFIPIIGTRLDDSSLWPFACPHHVLYFCRVTLHWYKLCSVDLYTPESGALHCSSSDLKHQQNVLALQAFSSPLHAISQNGVLPVFFPPSSYVSVCLFVFWSFSDSYFPLNSRGAATYPGTLLSAQTKRIDHVWENRSGCSIKQFEAVWCFLCTG